MTQAIQTNYPLFAVHAMTHALNGYVLFDLFDEALADLLVLKTYTHGTSPSSYCSIIQTGGLPSCGGREGHGEQLFISDGPLSCKGKFHVGQENTSLDSCDLINELNYKVFIPREYAAAAMRTELRANGYEDQYDMTSLLLSCCAPTLKFRFRPDEVEKQGFILDPTMGGSAVYTKQPITQDHIGLYGTLSHGLSCDLPGRITASPGQFLRGLVKLVIVVALAALFLVPELAPLLTAWLAWETAMCVCRLVVPMIAASICPAGPIESEAV